MESVNCVTANKTAVLERERTGCTMSLNRRVYDRGMRSLLWLSAGITCALLVFLMGYILWRGIPQLSWQFLTSSESVLKGTLGILPAICNTLYVVCVTLCIALPLGVGAAVYLTEYATNHKLVSAIEFAAETLSGIEGFQFFEDDHGRIVRRFFVPRAGEGAAAAVAQLEPYGVDALVCGALPGDERLETAAAGILLFPTFSGTPEEAALAFLGGTVARDPNNKCNACGFQSSCSLSGKGGCGKT